MITFLLGVAVGFVLALINFIFLKLNDKDKAKSNELQHQV